MSLELALFFETTFLGIYESFEKYSKKIKIAESSRSISPIKKKVKRSKVAGTTTDGKNNFLSSQAYQMML